MSWTDLYPYGTLVDVHYPFADGRRWVRAWVSGRTKSGFPVVSIPADGQPHTYTADRMTEIRAVQS